MTVTQLIRKLEKLKAEHGNCPVSVDVQGMRDRLIEECDISSIRDAVARQILVGDDDGGVAMTKRGQEISRLNFVLE